MKAPDPGALTDRVASGDRRALAQAITLAESTRPDDRARATEVLDRLLPRTGGAVRIGVSGAPGVGKSSFVEAFGGTLTAAGRTVAVLAVDPSSARSKGSILGDKTRMETLARDPNAFIRPSPAKGASGGVAPRTREAVLLCEAAGFDVVIVETVGVGQSETEVDDMVDVFLLLVGPGGGDELQGIKRGVMELADVLVVTKADGALLGPAQQAAADHRHALHLQRRKHPEWEPVVVLTSALANSGVGEVWEAVLAHHEAVDVPGLRARQATAWMWAEVRSQLLDRFRSDPAVRGLVTRLEADVAAGKVSSAAAAEQLLGAFLAN